METKQDKITCIHIILADYALNYFGDLFGSDQEATEACERLESALNRLPVGVSRTILDYCKINGFDVNIGHDVYGLYRKDRCFLPRIKELQKYAK